MKIKHKLILESVGIAVFVGTVGLAAVYSAQESLKKSIGATSVILAQEAMDKIDRAVFRRIEELEVLSTDTDLREHIAQSNQVFDRMPDLPGYVSAQNQEWQTVSQGTVTPFMRQLTDNRLAEKFMRMVRFYEAKRGYKVLSDISVTNKYGANLAQTVKTADYIQEDKPWWQTARRDGLYVSDVRYDQGMQGYFVDLAVRVDDDAGSFLGVLAAAMNIHVAVDVLDAVRDASGYEHADIRLLTKDGRMIYSTEGGGILQDASSTFSEFKEKGGAKQYFLTNKSGRERLYAGAFSKGRFEYKGLGWLLLIGYKTSDILAPVVYLRNLLLAITFMGVALSVVFGRMTSRSLLKLIKKLSDGAAQIGSGNLNMRMDVKSNDEIGEMSEAFDKMAADLDRQRTRLLEDQGCAVSVVNAVGDAVITSNEQGIIQSFNPAAERSFGYKANEAIGQNLSILMPSPHCERHDEYIRSYLATGKAKIIGVGRELEGKRRNGTLFPMELTVTEMQTADRKKVFIGLIRDLTAHKTSEKDVKATAKFPDESPHPVLRLAQDGVILYSNKPGKQLLFAWDRKVGEKARDYWCKIVVDVLQSGRNKEMEVACDESILLLTFVPIRDFGYVNIYGLDITERKKASSILKESEARIGSIVKAAVDGIITVSEQGIVQLFNPAASKIFGYDPEEVVGRGARMLMSPEIDREEYEHYIANYVRAGEKKIIGSSQEVSGRHKNGAIIPLDLSLSEMIMANGQRLFIGIVRDISERKRAEDEVQKAMAAKDDFTSMVSHELRTPLAISKEALSLILRRKVGEIPLRQEEIISMASANIDRLGYLINDILDATKVSAGKMALNKEMINVMDLVRENFEGWKLKSQTKGIVFELIAPEHSVVMYVDRVRFMQILSNLISNAIKFTPESGKITLTVQENVDTVKFLVADTGVGIAKEDIPKIFQKFQQLKRTYGPGIQGTGLGLNITKSLVELHGGQIFVNSELGKGTTFAFTIAKNQK